MKSYQVFVWTLLAATGCQSQSFQQVSWNGNTKVTCTTELEANITSPPHTFGDLSYCGLLYADQLIDFKCLEMQYLAGSSEWSSTEDCINDCAYCINQAQANETGVAFCDVSVKNTIARCWMGWDIHRK